MKLYSENDIIHYIQEAYDLGQQDLIELFNENYNSPKYFSTLLADRDATLFFMNGGTENNRGGFGDLPITVIPENQMNGFFMYVIVGHALRDAIPDSDMDVINWVLNVDRETLNKSLNNKIYVVHIDQKYCKLIKTYKTKDGQTIGEYESKIGDTIIFGKRTGVITVEQLLNSWKPEIKYKSSKSSSGSFFSKLKSKIQNYNNSKR